MRLGDKSGYTPTSKADSRQRGFLGDKLGQKQPLSCGFALRRALRSPVIVAQLQAHNRDSQAADLRKYGAPKGIQILIALVTIGTRWYSGAAVSPNSHQRVPTVTMYLGDKSDDKSGALSRLPRSSTDTSPSAQVRPFHGSPRRRAIRRSCTSDAATSKSYPSG